DSGWYPGNPFSKTVSASLSTAFSATAAASIGNLGKDVGWDCKSALENRKQYGAFEPSNREFGRVASVRYSPKASILCSTVKSRYGPEAAAARRPISSSSPRRTASRRPEPSTKAPGLRRARPWRSTRRRGWPYPFRSVSPGVLVAVRYLG